MAGIATGSKSPTSNVNVGAKANPTITGQTIGLTETTLVIPAGVKAYRIQHAGDTPASVYYATASGNTASSSTRFDIPIGGCLEDNLLVGGTSPLTFYVKATKENTVLQVWYWT